MDINLHFAKGALFENLIILEKIKRSLNQSNWSNFYFFRDSAGNEIDLLEENGLQLSAYEIKSSRTIHADFFKHLLNFRKLAPQTSLNLIHAGEGQQTRNEIQVLGFDVF